MSAKKVLVTGATGFIGQYVINELLSRNLHVISSSTNTGTASQKEWFAKTEFIPFNFDEYNETENYYNYFSQPDFMIHLAWQGLPNYKADFHYTKNLTLQCSFLKNLIEHGLKDLTVTGTCFEYGMKDGILNEDMQPAPANPYSKAKDELRKEIDSLKNKNNFSFKWVRLFYMYGKGQNPNSLFSQLDKAIENSDESFNMSGGEQIRDFLPVDKVAESIVAIALQKDTDGIINCCSGKPVKVKELVKQYLKNKNSNMKLNLGYYPYPDYEPMEFWGDASKLNKILQPEI